MKKYLYLLFVVGLTSLTASAQQTLNGNLEPSAALLASSYCANIGPNIYNAGMPHTAMTIAAGSYTLIADSNCGGARYGVTCVGMFYNATASNGNLLSFKLTSFLVPLHTYQFAVFIKASTSVAACGLNFGYMNDSTGAVDSTSTDTIAAPTTSTAWLRVTGSFTPTKNDQFFFLQARPGPGGTDGLTFIDSVRILNPANDVELWNQPSIAVNAYPNPFTGTTTISIDERAVLPCNIAVTDMLGRTVLQRNIAQRKTNLDMTDLPKGAYFLRLSDRNNNNSFIKLITE